MATSQYSYGGPSIFNMDVGGGSPAGAFGGAGGGGGGGEASWFQDPDNMRQLAFVLAKLGQAMGEKGSFGEKLGGSVAQMASASATGRGMQITGTPQVAPQQPGANLKVLGQTNVADDLSALSAAMKKLSAVSPENIPKGYESSLIGSLFADPNAPINNIASNPTVPASANVSGPADVEALLPAQIPENIAMLMEPAQVAQTYDYGRLMQGQRFTQEVTRATEGRAERTLTMEEKKWANELDIQPTKMAYIKAQTENLSSDAAYKDWERSPPGQEAKYKLAAAGVTEAAKAEQMKIAAVKSSIKTFKEANPELASKVIEGSPFNIGQILDISADNSHAGTTLSSMLNSTLDYKAARERNVVLEKQLAQSKQDSTENKIYMQITRNAEVLRKMNALHSEDRYDTSTPEGKRELASDRLMGQVRTPDMDVEIKRLQKAQEQLYKKVGLEYTPLAFLDAGQTGKTAGVVTMEDLKKRAAEKEKKMSGLQSFVEMFRGPSIFGTGEKPKVEFMKEFNRMLGTGGEAQ